jgi:hypothetical protein
VSARPSLGAGTEQDQLFRAGQPLHHGSTADRERSVYPGPAAYGIGTRSRRPPRIRGYGTGGRNTWRPPQVCGKSRRLQGRASSGDGTVAGQAGEDTRACRRSERSRTTTATS